MRSSMMLDAFQIVTGAPSTCRRPGPLAAPTNCHYESFQVCRVRIPARVPTVEEWRCLNRALACDAPQP